MVPPELEQDAFRAGGGELGWTRAPIPAVVRALNIIHPLPTCLDAQVTRKLASNLQGLVRPLNSSSSEGTVAAASDHYSHH